MKIAHNVTQNVHHSSGFLRIDVQTLVKSPIGVQHEEDDSQQHRLRGSAGGTLVTAHEIQDILDIDRGTGLLVVDVQTEPEEIGEVGKSKHVEVAEPVMGHFDLVHFALQWSIQTFPIF